jgi:hypothetical protein
MITTPPSFFTDTQGQPSKPGDRIEIVVRIPEEAATKSAKWAGF